MIFRGLLLFFTFCTKIFVYVSTDEGQCSLEAAESCKSATVEHNKYDKESNFANEILKSIETAVAEYQPCATETDTACSCYKHVIENDLSRFRPNGITKQMFKDSLVFGTQYKILEHRVYRSPDCMFPARCQGIEHFLLHLAPGLPDMDLVVNTRDYPQLASIFYSNHAVFSFSKNANYADILYPAWTFWAGGPAISLFPTGIGRWDKLRVSVMAAAEKYPWSKKQDLAFFRGSRTSDERDTLVLLSRKKPDLVDAKYTKNQAWKSPKDTLNAEPAREVSFEDHCKYKYLFNFRGVAASFRFKHLFLCKSLVFHVGDEWKEFFYHSLKPWVHYVPLQSYPSEKELEQIIAFFHNHQQLAQEIANRGYEFIKNHLKMSDIECYWRRLLLEYSQLLKFPITPDKTLIEIK